MVKSPAPFELATHIHSTLYNPELTAFDRYNMAAASGLRVFYADTAPLSHTERLTAIDNTVAYQHLSRSPKTGMFFLTTAFPYPRGEVLRTHISDLAEPEVTDILESTLFMRVMRSL